MPYKVAVECSTKLLLPFGSVNLMLVIVAESFHRPATRVWNEAVALFSATLSTDTDFPFEEA
jgi:hypothetical protein